MDEQDAVADSEFVHRRIHRTYFDSRLPVPVRAAAFRPNQQDATGISLFRAALVQPSDILASVDPAKLHDYYVVRFATRDLLNRGLTVEPEPDAAGPPGHVVIPELSWAVYQGDKQRLKQISVELAKLASADIVHRPS